VVVVVAAAAAAATFVVMAAVMSVAVAVFLQKTAFFLMTSIAHRNKVFLK
jgi:hypothetical protein